MSEEDDGVYPEEELAKVEEVCVDILPGIWRNVIKENLIISKCSGGIANRVYFVCLSPDLEPTVYGTEPLKVIVRLYGSAILQNIDEPRLLGDDVEIVTFHLLSSFNLGPRLLGVFPKGRIEEYIENSRPENKYLEKRVVNKVMASIFARIHSLELPITRKHIFYQNLFHGIMAERIAKEGDFIATYNEKLTKMSDEMDKFPFQKQLAWLDRTSVAIGAKSVFCHNDLHLYNILFRTHDANGNALPKDYDSNDFDAWSSKMIPIDFELSSFGWRGYDLAYYLNFRYYHPCEGECDNDKIKFPDSDEILTFIKDYLSFASEYDPRFDPGIDNVEQLVKEVELASLFTHLFLFGWSINDRRIGTQLEWSKNYPYIRFKMYELERSRFIEKYHVSGDL